MRYRKLSADGDYQFGNGQKDFYRDVPEAVGQACQTRLLLWLGEWFLNIDDGTPYMISVLGKHSQTDADVTIQTVINGTQGMVSIANYESTIDADNRIMSVTCDINTIYGPSELDIQNFTNF